MIGARTSSLSPATVASRSLRAAPPPPYVGRFAPSPTGDLHLGSLVAAVGSYLDARHHGGRWLLRIEDLDSTRVIPGCADRILRTLECFGLWWDGEVSWQSRRIGHYTAVADELTAKGLTFQCSCSRRDLSGNGDTGYPGTCRGGPTRRGPVATRFRMDESEIVSFEDRVQGGCRIELQALGDCIITRKDGVPSYQLAVVVDDAEQHVTDVVRGADLLDSTAWQLALQRALGRPAPRYAHLPLVVEPTRAKLAKSRRSVPVDAASAGAQLACALRLLNHPPPRELEHGSPGNLLEWAARTWHLDAFHGWRTVPAPAHLPR
ncbi:MAG: tRNA glutamyl-Q(34) synthetase GluQRS [Steroidobacteraceae bacterium]